MIAVSAFLLLLAADTEMFHGRQSWLVQNDQVQLRLLSGGGHIGEFRFRSGDAKRTVNPMRVPHYPTIDPHTYNPAKHDAIYGDDPHRWMSSGYMGHFICFPFFGPPSSKFEVAAGLGNHGEAPIVEWKLTGPIESTAELTRLRYQADLPKTQYRMGRTVTLRKGETVALVEEWAESLTAFDRPANWMQHATFGPPFIAPGKSQMDLSGTRARVAGGDPKTTSLKPSLEFVWPKASTSSGQGADARMFQPSATSGVYVAVLMDPSRRLGYFTMYNPDFPVLIGYLYRTSEVPWLGDFQENHRMKHKPWNGEVVTRGIEFGSTPFANGLRNSVEMGKLFDVPTYRWIGAREKQTMNFAMFLAEIPAGFAGVEDVALEGKAIVIRERGSARRITLPATGLGAFQ